MMNDLTLIIVLMAVALGIGISNILCFLIGFKTALKLSNKASDNEPINKERTYYKSPMQIFKEKEAQKELEKEINDISKSLENIDNYGSDKPQQEI
jgi:hypothetical protein